MKWRDVSPNEYRARLSELRRQLDEDPYSVLELSSAATDEEVRSSYRRFLQRYHPDRQDPFLKQHCEELVKIVNIAYDRIRSRHRS